MAKHLCPVWIGHLLASPIRKLMHDPEQILAPHICSGMMVMDIGSAMGFFSLRMARLVGANGRVVCIDVQKKMLDKLMQRAQKAGLSGRIRPRTCGSTSLSIGDLTGQIDFALAFAVVHEVADAAAFFTDACSAMKPEAHLLVAEPRGHVSEKQFERSVEAARCVGFDAAGSPRIFRSHTVLLKK